MIIKKEDNSSIYDKEGATGFLIHNRNNCEYVRLIIEPDSGIEQHSLPFPITFYILKGSPTAIVDDKYYETNEGDLLEVDKDIQRGWRNNSGTAAEILAVKHI